MVTELKLKVLLEINKHFPLLNTTSSKPHVFNTITIYVFANTNSRVSFDFGTKTYKQKIWTVQNKDLTIAHRIEFKVVKVGNER